MKLRHNKSTIGLILITLLLSSCSDYTVGVTTMVFSNSKITKNISPEMQSLLGLEEGESRDLMVKIWYPAASNPDEASRLHYGYHTENNDYAIDPEDMATLEFLRANEQQSQSYQNAEPLNEQSFPVIFYSHGYGGLIEENQPYYEALAENGYIVVSIGHTHEANLVTLADDEVVLINPAFEADLFNRELPLAEQKPALEMSDADVENLAALPLGKKVPKKLLKRYHYTTAAIERGNQEHLNLWVTDIQFVLSQLRKVNRGEIYSDLQGIFDLNRIGAVGYSYGGAAARRFCNIELKCLASINMDGSPAALFNEKIIRPHLQYSNDINASAAQEIVENSELREDEFESVLQEFFMEKQNSAHATINAAMADLYILTLNTITHDDFTARWLDSFYPGLGKEVWHDMIEHTSLGFLHAYVKHDLSKKRRCAKIRKYYHRFLDFFDNNIFLDYTNVCTHFFANKTG